MSTNQDQVLAVREEAALARKPREVIADAKEQADALMEIVNDRKLFAVIDGEPYLEAEAWEIICAFNNVAPDVAYVLAIQGPSGETVAYEAKVNLLDIRTGALRGSGVAECSLDAPSTKGREGRDKDKAAKSTAQTWAISKAARLAFSWVAVLAGFQPTPASEMKGSGSQTDHGTCGEHGVRYFQSKNMRSPAHKTDDGEWCNKPEEDREPVAPRAASRPPRRAQNGPLRHSNDPITGPDTAYDQDGEVETRSPQQAAAGAKDVKGIKNGGDFMEYVNARWPGHNQQDILGCLNVQKISDLEFKPKKVSGYAATLIGFWGTGEFDEDGVIQEPEAEPAQEEGADVTSEDAEEAAAQTAP
jgi:hypothetical protein